MIIIQYLNMNQLIRDLQIDLILDNPNPIIDTFNGIWNDLSVIESNVYHERGGEFIYYDSNKEWIFYQDDKNDNFWCHYDRYWSIFVFKVNINHTYIPLITKFLVEKALNNRIATPDYRLLAM